LCNWEDHGQDDENADEVWGGPKLDYSLAEAQANFLKYRVMYERNRDQRITAGDSLLEYETKGLLMDALSNLRSCTPTQQQNLAQEILRLEAILKTETTRKIKKHEAKHSDEVGKSVA
jgi:hypothetical protein